MPFSHLPDTWQRCLRLYLQSILDHSGSTASVETYRSTLARFLANGRAPSEYSRGDVLLFLQAPSISRRNYGHPVSASTKNQRLCVLRSFYTFASGYDDDTGGSPLFTKALPTAGIRYLKLAVTPRYLTGQEIERLFAAIPPTVKGARDRALFLTYFFTARRRRELAALAVGDIEDAVIVDPDGGHRRGHVYHFYQKGNSRERRTAELPEMAYQAILHYWRVSGRMHTLVPTDPVFTSTKPGIGRRGSVKNVPLCPDYINSLLKSYLKEAGLDASLYSLHALRHTSARERYAAGEGVVAIQRVLGHSNLGTTQRYLTLLSGVADPGAALLEQRFGRL